jgi:hypothetical protein
VRAALEERMPETEDGLRPRFPLGVMPSAPFRRATTVPVVAGAAPQNREHIEADRRTFSSPAASQNSEAYISIAYPARL